MRRSWLKAKNNLLSFLKKYLLEKPYRLLLRNKAVSHHLGWYGLHRFVKNGPNNLRNYFYLFLFSHRNRKAKERLIAELMSQNECAEIIRNRLPIKGMSIDQLAKHNSGTLGHAFFDHIIKNNIKMIGTTDVKIHTDHQYIMHRLLLTHDLYHTVLNAGTDLYGETVVASFTCAQIPSYVVPLTHLAAGMLYCVTANQESIDKGNLGYITGWLVGKHAKQLFAVDWDSLWHLPLEEVQKILCIDLKTPKKEINEFCDINRYRVAPTQLKSPTIKDFVMYNHFTLQEHFIPLNDHDDQDASIFVTDFKPVNTTADAIVIVGHAMFANSRYLTNPARPSIVSCLIKHNFRVLVPDMRSHGKSNYFKTWSFEDLLKDVSTCIEFAKKTQPNTPIFLVGHSLGGLSYLVHQGTTIPENKVKGIIILGAVTWNKHFIAKENIIYRNRIKAVAKLSKLLCNIYGYIPAKMTGFGSDNECREIAQQVIFNNFDKGVWLSSDQTTDYYNVFKNIDSPILSIGSVDDKYGGEKHTRALNSNLFPEPEYLFTKKISHMGLCTAIDMWDTWEKAAQWLKSKL